MNKTKITKLLITVLCFSIVASLCATVFAFSPASVSPTDSGMDNVKTLGNKIAGAVKIVGIFASVIVLMILGIKYMMGSAEEKAEYKKTFIPYIVGAIILFGASLFADKIYTFATNLFSTT